MRLPVRVMAGLLFAAAGFMASCRAPVTSDPDPRNELPFGYLDSPGAGETVERDMPARGWALDDKGISEVRIFLDNHFVGRTTLSESRPDVTKAYPQYSHGTDVHGWALLVPLGAGASIGQHVILVQVVDNQGATRDIATVPVKLVH